MSKKKIPLSKARLIANQYFEQLNEHCEKIAIAGSIRRKKPLVGDIEIILQPKGFELKDMFGGEPQIQYPIYDIIKGVFFGLEAKRDGARLKTFIRKDGVQVDLFLVLPPAQWGYRYAITTGPKEWNKYLVTPRRFRGAFPPGYEMDKGAIYTLEGELIEMPEEGDYFEFLGLPREIEMEKRKPPIEFVPF